MPSQKGSLLDKIKAFFIRRRDKKLKKKQQEQKELEEILKNISEKVESTGTVVRVGVAAERLDLSKITLTNSKTTRVVQNHEETLEQQLKPEEPKPDIEQLKEEKQPIKQVDSKEQTKNLDSKDNKISPYQNEIEQTIDIMDDSASLHRLRETLLLQVSIKENIAKTKDNIDEEKFTAKTNDASDKKEEPKLKETSKKEDNIVLNKPKEEKKQVQSQDLNNLENKNEKFNSKKGIVVSSKKIKGIKQISNSRIKVKPSGLFNFKKAKLKEQTIKTKEEEVSLILIRMIDRNLSELDYFKEELDYLTDKNKNAKTKEEIFEIEQRFLILKERLERVYNDFLTCRDKNLLENVYSVNYNEELVDIITKYKLEYKENGSIEEVLRNIESDYKNSLNVIESIICLEESKEILGEEIYQNKEDIRVRDEQIDITNEYLEKIDYMKEELDRNTKTNKEIVDNMISKISTIHPEERVAFHYNIINNLLTSAISFATSFALLNPRKGRLSNALGAVNMLNSVRMLRHAFEPTKEIYYVSSNDFENEIIEHLNDFSYINKSIDMSIEEIDKIKEEFDDKFLAYIDDIEGLKDTYITVNRLQEQLKDIKVEMKYQEQKLEHAKNLNNQMVKKIEES